MIYKEHTRNQKRMYRIHKQEEKIQEQELIIASLQEKIDKVINKCTNKLFETNDEWLVRFAKELLEILGDKE